MPTLRTRLQHAWNAFLGRDAPSHRDYGPGDGYRQDRHRTLRSNYKSMVTSIYNRIAMDVAAISIRHVRLDENGRYKEDMDSSLNECLTLSANLDQTSRSFVQDIVMTMFDEGCAAVVPVDTTFDPNVTKSYDILSARVGVITQWYPEYVEVELYNQKSGRRERIRLSKEFVAIVENPLYSVMNEPNSTMQRLIRKLNLLDAIDEQSSSGKLDLIIQLPYVIKTDARRAQAEKRRKDIEEQLAGTKYGIAYTDGTEKITQLNRSLDNNLMHQIEYLTSQLYNQLGLTEDVFNGTADEKTMLNYQNRSIEPIISAICLEMKRKWITKTARSQGQTIMFFSEPFKLVPVEKIADIADKFTRNEIMSPNEIRQIVGFKPSDDPKSDELRNRNNKDPDLGDGQQGNPEGQDSYSEEVVEQSAIRDKLPYKGSRHRPLKKNKEVT